MLLLKQPAERLIHPVTIAGQSTISALHSVETVARGLVSGAAALAVTPSLFAGALTLTIEGGSDGEHYLITVQADDAEGERREDEIEIACVNFDWAMPDGGAPMLTIGEFILRFTFEEVVRLTDARGDGRIGKDVLVNALVDAQAMVEAAVSGRYALPLDPVPVLLKAAIADLARARLYPGAIPDGVAGQARAAERTLERIRKGEVPVPGAAAADAAASETFVLVQTGGRAYPDGLADF